METPVAHQPSGSDTIWSVLSHLSWFIGVPFLLPLVVYLVMRRESDYVAANAGAALNFHLSLILYGLCCIPLIFVVVGIPLLIVIGLAMVVLSIIGAFAASRGECYHYPVTIPFVS